MRCLGTDREYNSVLLHLLSSNSFRAEGYQTSSLSRGMHDKGSPSNILCITSFCGTYMWAFYGWCGVRGYILKPKVFHSIVHAYCSQITCLDILDHKIIEQSQSKRGSPVILVPKPDARLAKGSIVTLGS